MRGCPHCPSEEAVSDSFETSFVRAKPTVSFMCNSYFASFNDSEHVHQLSHELLDSGYRGYLLYTWSVAGCSVPSIDTEEIATKLYEKIYLLLHTPRCRSLLRIDLVARRREQDEFNTTPYKKLL